MLTVNIRSWLGVAMVTALTGCAIHQKVAPVQVAGGDRNICIIENPSVKAGFLEAYRRSLSEKGFVVRQLPASSSVLDCPVTSTYSANWRWDLALYMAYAEIKVYNDGRVIGEAKYDSQNGGANMGKFIDAEGKIRELVSLLFPHGASHS